MVTLDEIYEFLHNCLVVKDSSKLEEDSDIYKDFNVNGDDFFELMEAFAEQYSVDLSNYNWFFHHESEGYLLNWSAQYFKPQRERIPITPKLLLESANTHKWPLNYPPTPPDLPWRRTHLLNWSPMLLLIPLFLFLIWIRK